MRLHDNPVLGHIKSSAASAANVEVLPVFCYDPRQYGTTAFGSPKTGVHRAKFLLESVADLKSSLRAIGSDLLIGIGKPEELLPELAAACDLDGTAAATKVLCQAQAASEELAVDAALRAALPAGTELLPLWGGALYERSELPFAADLSDLPDVFTPFRNLVEKRCSVRAPLAPPQRGELPLPARGRFTLPARLSWDAPTTADELAALAGAGFTGEQLAAPPDPRAAIALVGGESAALARLNHYLWGSDALATYFETRNGMLGADYSSKLAPWLALGDEGSRLPTNRGPPKLSALPFPGNLSPRLVAAECARYVSRSRST